MSQKIVNEVISFFKLNRGSNLIVNANSFETPSASKMFEISNLTVNSDEKFIYINNYKISIDHIVNFYLTKNWGSTVRIALVSDDVNFINEINLTCNDPEVNGENVPFKLTPYLRQQMK